MFQRHLGKIFISVGILIMVLVLATTTKIEKTMEARQGPAYHYFDDGKGLVHVQGFDQSTTFKSFQSWRDDHPDRFKRIMSIAVSSYWTGAIITYNPDSIAVAP